MTVIEGLAPYGDYQSWHRVTGDLKSGKPPLFVLHGGPGCTHDYVDSFKHLASGGRAVVHYDQVGNGRSTHLRDKGAGFWTVDFFRKERTKPGPAARAATIALASPADGRFGTYRGCNRILYDARLVIQQTEWQRRICKHAPAAVIRP